MRFVRWKPRLPTSNGFLLVILALAAVLRLIRLEGRGLEYDDAFSALLAARPWGDIITGTAADTMPPLYYFLLHLWMALGRQVWWLRSLNVLLSLALVWLLYQLTRRLFGVPAGLIAAGLAALSPLQLFHAQGLRMYVTLALALLGYTWFFARLWLPGREGVSNRLDWAGLVVCGTAAMYSHNLAVFTLVAPDFLLLFKRDWRTLGRLLIAQGAIALLAAPWLVLVPGQVAKVQTAFWTPRPGLLEVLQALVTFHTNLPVPGWFLIPAVLVSLWILALVTLEIGLRGREDPGVHLLVAFALVPPLLLLVVSYVIRPVFLPRPLMLSSLAYYALVGRAASHARTPFIGALMTGLFAIAALLVLPAQYTDASFPRSPFRQTTAYLARVVSPGDVILHDNKLSHFPSYFYEPGLPQTFLPDAPGSHNDTLAPATQDALGLHPAPDITTAVGEAHRVWFVVFQRALDEYGGDHPQMAWLESRFSPVERRLFNDLLLVEYVR